MNKNLIQLNLKEESILKILRIYYKDNEDFTGKIEIKKCVKTKNHYSEEYDVADIHFVMTGTIEYLGEEIPYEREVSWHEAVEIIKLFLEENDFQTEVLESDARIDYQDNNSEKVVVFNGIKCQVNRLEKSKKK